MEGKKLAAVVYAFEAGQLTSKPKTETLGADKAKLLSSEKGTTLTGFLEINFAKIVDYEFPSYSSRKTPSRAVLLNYFPRRRSAGLLTSCPLVAPTAGVFTVPTPKQKGAVGEKSRQPPGQP